MVDNVTVCISSVHALWWFESPDHRAEIRHTAHHDARVVAAGETPPIMTSHTDENPSYINQ